MTSGIEKWHRGADCTFKGELSSGCVDYVGFEEVIAGGVCDSYLDHAFDTTGAVTSFFDGGGACGAGSDSNNQDLFYTWTAPSAGDFVFDTVGSSYDTKPSIHDGMDCAATCLGYNDDTNGFQSEVSVTGIAAGQVLLVQVGGFGAGGGAGTLNIGVFVDPCAAVMPDAFEDNDDCATATPLGDGTYSGLTILGDDFDFYSVSVDDGATLSVDIFFLVFVEFSRSVFDFFRILHRRVDF